MSKKRASLRFEVQINGRSACTSGMDGFGVLDVVLTRVKRNPKSYPGKNAHPLKLSKAAWAKEHIDLYVGGLDTNHTDQHLHWLRENIKIGDEITIKVLPSGAIDKPLGRRRRLTTRS